MSARLQRVTALGPIETGIPMPASTARNNALRQHMKVLKVGQSFVTNCGTGSIHAMARRLDIKCETRAMNGSDVMRRVWRIE